MKGFKDFSKSAKIYITVRHASVTFSAACLDVLGSPEHVQLKIEEAGTRVAFVPSEETSSSFPFFHKVPKGKQLVLRISSRDVIREFEKITGVDYDNTGVKYAGEYDNAENALVFELKTAA